MRSKSFTQPRPRFGVTKPRLVCVVLTTFLLSSSLAAPAVAQWGKEITLNGAVTAKPLPRAEIASVTTQDAWVKNHNFQTTETVSVSYPTSDGTDLGMPAEVRLTVRALPSSGLQQKMSVSVWPVAGNATCTESSAPAGNSVAGPWTQNVVSEPLQIQPGGVATFCVRGYPTVSTPKTDRFTPEQNRPATVAAVATVNTGTQVFTQPAEYQAQLASNGVSTDSEVAVSPSVIATERIFPIENIDQNFRFAITPNSRVAMCWWVYGNPTTGMVAVGTQVGVMSCGTRRSFNQFQRIAQPDSGAVQIRMKDGDPQMGYISAASVNSQILTAKQDANDAHQLWIPQRLPEGQTQMVNVFSGQCFYNAQQSVSASIMRDCSSDPNQVPNFATHWRW